MNCYVSKCVKPGMKCSDCENLIHCVGYPNANLTSNYILYCNNSDNQFCSVEAGGCVDDFRECNKFGLQNIDCQTVGKFPDPYDCNSYHVCSENKGILYSTMHRCPDDKAFDPLTGTCRFKPNHEVCTKSPLPKCIKPLQTEPVKLNPNIYFVCVYKNSELKHIFYRCEPGQSFFRDTCVETTFRCQAKGKYKDNTNCRKYYHCNENLTYTHRSCHPERYFNTEQSTCVKGICDDEK